jgi:hypothetical protein
VASRKDESTRLFVDVCDSALFKTWRSDQKLKFLGEARSVEMQSAKDLSFASLATVPLALTSALQTRIEN